MALKPAYSLVSPEMPSWAKSGESLRSFDDSKTNSPWKNPWKGREWRGAIGGGAPALFGQKNDPVAPTRSVFNPTSFDDLGTGAQVKSVDVIGNPTGSNSGTKVDWNKIGSHVSKVVPFASNLVNTFRKAPMPSLPGTLSPVNLDRVNYSAERAEADRIVQGADANAERTLSGNTAAAVRSANLAQKFRMYSDSYQRENNSNTEIGNREKLINSSIEEKNTRARDSHNQQLTEMRIAEQNARSANLSNAADKFIAMKNEKAKQDVDADKFTAMSRAFQDVMPRYEEWMKERGVTIPKKRFGGKLKKAY